MSRQTAETLLISALINNRDALAYRAYGVHSEQFYGYRAEFDWVVSFHERFGRCPSAEEMAVQFPEFPVSTTQTEVHWPCVELIREYSARKLSRALLKASTDLKAGLIEEAFEKLRGLELMTVAEKPKNMLIDPSFLDDYGQVLDGIPLPWPTLQRLTDGIGKGELWYMAARPGNGKTSTMLNVITQAALAGYRVAMYSLEMTKRQVQTKAHAIMAHELGIAVSQRDMASRRFDVLEYRRLLAKIEERLEFTSGHLHVHTPADGPVTPAVIDAHAREYDLIAVDYIGLMTTDGAAAVDDWRVLAKISNSLKQTALRHNVAILAASQINRDGDSVSGKPARLRNLTGSDALAQDGDVVVTMAQVCQTAEAYSLEKNRHGEGGHKWYSRYLPDMGDFTEISKDAADELRYASVGDD